MPSHILRVLVAALLLVAAGCGRSPECGPDACIELGYECGQHLDGCGDALDCGDCGEWHECDDAVCLCIPQSCETLGLACGTHDDRCGEEIECGTCSWPLTCDVPGICVEPDEPPDVLDGLLLIPGLDVREVPADVQGTRAFLLELEQPEFHAEPSQETFMQKMLLIHRHLNAPMVMHNIGYGFGIFGRSREELTFYLTEPAHLLGANQLLVEHRFFGDSIPESPTWTALNIEESAGDSHRIVEALSSVYTGPWVGTGVSKGGMTAVFHERFFPDDLAAVVPYVSPISFGEDERYISHLSSIGPEDGVCRERVLDMALEVVERRAEGAQLLRDQVPEAAQMETAELEALVTFPAFSFHWSFWQFYGSEEACLALPARGAPFETLAEWVLGGPRSDLAGLLDPYAYDSSISPYQYQVSNELGRQAIDYGHLLEEIAKIDYGVIEGPRYPPWGSPPAFDPEAMLRVDDCLKEEADQVLAIYGEFDPWTAGMITLNPSADNLVIVGPGLNHGASIGKLTSDLEEAALDRLEAWILGPFPTGLRQRSSADMPAARCLNTELSERIFEIERRMATISVMEDLARARSAGE